MRVAYLDCFSGVSGDMLLGALLDAGVDPALMRSTVTALSVDARIEFDRVDRSGISAIKVHVITPEGEKDHAHAVLAAGCHQQSSPDRHECHSDRSPAYAGRNQDHVHSRSFAEICELVSNAQLDPAAKQLALRTFRLLGEAEARVHNLPLEEIHFHEVGAIDAIVDIVCAAVGSLALGVQRWFCSPLNVGSGSMECAHGIFPVPAPATSELLQSAPAYSSGVRAELVTPTGAAMLRALDVEFADLPLMTIQGRGYGAGTRDLPGVANVLRITLGESDGNTVSDVVAVLETAVDDMTPQLIGYVMDRALAEGALDVMITPVYMKKNRPGHLLTVLCRPQDASRQRDLLVRETTTLGVRIRQDRRECVQRSFETAHTRWGDVRVKLGHLDRELVNCAPEFEDCRRLAQQHNIALKTVMQEALRAFQRERAAGVKGR